MTGINKKKLGEERREWLLQLLKNSPSPVTGSELAKMANVSRQVIVSDVTLLKARNEPIIATSQGYIYLAAGTAGEKIEKTIVCFHSRQQAEEELNIIVDHGVTVKDVRVEHPVYGDLTASIMVSTRDDVQQFLKKIADTNASLLSDLTSGIHLHTLIANNRTVLDSVERALKEAGILMEEK